MSRRKRIIEAVEKTPLTVEEIAILAEVKVKTVLDDLKHIKHSLKNCNKTLYLEPPFCPTCGRIIKLQEIKDIRKCPKCKSENVSRARYFIR